MEHGWNLLAAETGKQRESNRFTSDTTRTYLFSEKFHFFHTTRHGERCEVRLESHHRVALRGARPRSVSG